MPRNQNLFSVATAVQWSHQPWCSLGRDLSRTQKYLKGLEGNGGEEGRGEACEPGHRQANAEVRRSGAGHVDEAEEVVEPTFCSNLRVLAVQLDSLHEDPDSFV